MERIQSINPQRIQWCCDDRGITPEELASEVGITPTSMGRLMGGEDRITFNQLRKLANYFNRGLLFFLEPEPVNDERVHTPQFRTLANQKPELSAKLKALIERVENQREVYLSLRQDLGEAEQPMLVLPELPHDNSKRAAGLAREWLGLGESNAFSNYRQAVEAKGILVFRSNGYSGKWQIPKEDPICGFALYDPDCPVIVVKKQAVESRQSFTLMHELGHVLLHQASFIDEEEDLNFYQGNEREANAFAGCLLVPDALLNQINITNRPDEPAQYDEWLEQFRQEWGVSGEVILRRLLDEGRLPKAKYLAYREWRGSMAIPETEGGTRQYRHREPKHVFGEPFVRTVLDALHAKQITLARASTYLDNLKVADVHLLEDTFEHL